MNDFSNTVGIVLAGGMGSRLSPLTADRAKPAVPFGGKYRIVDFTLSNCVNSGLRRVLVLTQYKSQSLQRHLRDGWSIFNPQLGEYITAVPPQMRTGDSWYCGTADAVYQNLYLLERSHAKYVVILSGDHIYRMDYGRMLHFHQASSADVSVACMEVDLHEARSFGVVSLDRAQRICEFEEKPRQPRSLPDNPHRALASMGIYIFSTELLCRELKADHDDPTSSHDFGKDILPRLIHTHRVDGYHFGEEGDSVQDCYWRDVGTLDAYYDANMELLSDPPALDLYDSDWPIRTFNRQAPPAHVSVDSGWHGGAVHESLLSNGVVVGGGVVEHSILSPGVRVATGAVVRNAILLDDVGVGAGSVLQNCIIDKGVRVPAKTSIGLDPEGDAMQFTVSENGVVTVPKGTQFAQPSRSQPADSVDLKPLLN